MKNHILLIAVLVISLVAASSDSQSHNGENTSLHHHSLETLAAEDTLITIDHNDCLARAHPRNFCRRGKMGGKMGGNGGASSVNNTGKPLGGEGLQVTGGTATSAFSYILSYVYGKIMGAIGSFAGYWTAKAYNAITDKAG